MKVEFREILLSSAALVALTPGGIDFGIQRQGRPVGNVVLTQVSALPDYGLDGRLSLTVYRVQVDCYGSSAALAAEIARQVLIAVDGYRTEPFQGVFLITSRDMMAGDENSEIHRVSMDLEVVHRG